MSARIVAITPPLSDAPTALGWLVSEGYSRKNEDGCYRAFQAPRWFHLDLYVCAVTILAQAAFEVCGEPATVQIRGAYGVLGYQLAEAPAALDGAA